MWWHPAVVSCLGNSVHFCPRSLSYQDSRFLDARWLRMGMIWKVRLNNLSESQLSSCFTFSDPSPCLAPQCLSPHRYVREHPWSKIKWLINSHSSSMSSSFHMPKPQVEHSLYIQLFHHIARICLDIYPLGIGIWLPMYTWPRSASVVAYVRFQLADDANQLTNQVRYVWSGHWSLGKFLFLLNRYLPFIDVFISIHRLYFFSTYFRYDANIAPFQ